MKFKFELHVFQDGRLDEVLETPVNVFKDATQLAEALCQFSLIQSGAGRWPAVESKQYWEEEWSRQNFMRQRHERQEPHFHFGHLVKLAEQVNKRNYDGLEKLKTGTSIALPSLQQGYSHRTCLVISKVIPISDKQI